MRRPSQARREPVIRMSPKWRNASWSPRLVSLETLLGSGGPEKGIGEEGRKNSRISGLALHMCGISRPGRCSVALPLCRRALHDPASTETLPSTTPDFNRLHHQLVTNSNKGAGWPRPNQENDYSTENGPRCCFGGVCGDEQQEF